MYRPEPSSPELCASDPSVETRLPTAFGHPTYLAVYRKTKDLIYRHKVMRMCDYEEVDGVKILTLCNLWRIEKDVDQQVTLHQFDLETEQWQSTDSLEHWPDFPFYPIKMTQSVRWGRDVLRKAIWEVLHFAGYQTLWDIKKKQNATTHTLAEDCHAMDHINGTTKLISPTKFAEKLIDFYLGKYKLYSGRKSNDIEIEHDGVTTPFKPGQLHPELIDAYAKKLRGTFCREFIDNEIFSAALVIDYKYLTFKRYLHYASHRKGFLKVAREHRNLLPLLEQIKPKHWERDDLFSRKLWVKNGRKTTLIDRPKFRTHFFAKRDKRLHSFAQNREWRWLVRTSPVIVTAWLFNYDPVLLPNLVQTNVTAKVPVIAYIAVIQMAYRFRRYGVDTRIQQIYRLFLQQTASVWAAQGYTSVRKWIKAHRSDLGDVLDYLEDEGFARGQPYRNATWSSLIRQSHNWHQRIALERFRAAIDEQEVVTWESKLAETRIGKYLFKPLCSNLDMAIEGYALKHCIAAYWTACHEGRYRAFSVEDTEGGRSTLGFYLKRKKVVFDQHRGPHNLAVSAETLDAGMELAALYQAALKPSKKTIDLARISKTH